MESTEKKSKGVKPPEINAPIYSAKMEKLKSGKSDQALRARLPCANHTVPYGTALLRCAVPRHFVPGYDRTVPPGLARFRILQLLQLLNS
jgi:hypothetical protein